MSCFETCIPTGWGTFRAVFSPAGLTRLTFPEPGRIEPSAETTGSRAPNSVRPWIRLVQQALHDLLAGRPLRTPPPPLAPEPPGTHFQQQVWAVIRRIPRGATLTYGEIAARLSLPRAARAVGQACGANPIPLFIPCHRVLAANRRLGGFTAGTSWKHRLLELEGVLVSPPATPALGNPACGSTLGHRR